MLLFFQTEQGGPEKGSLDQVEGLLGLFINKRLCLGFPLCPGEIPEVYDWDVEGGSGGDDLDRLPIDCKEGSTQGLVASDDLVKALLQGEDVEEPGEP